MCQKPRKKRRHDMLETLQAQILAEHNQKYLGERVQVLVEDVQKGRWRGRTPQNKLVFFDADGDFQGKLVDVEITWTSPWSLQGRLPQYEASSEPLLVFS